MDRDQPAPPDYLITCKDKDFRRTGMRTMRRRMRRRMRRMRRRRRRRRRKMMKMMTMTVAFRILHTPLRNGELWEVQEEKKEE